MIDSLYGISTSISSASVSAGTPPSRPSIAPGPLPLRNHHHNGNYRDGSYLGVAVDRRQLRPDDLGVRVPVVFFAHGLTMPRAWPPAHVEVTGRTEGGRVR
jgi:hypothetical protein